MYTGLRVVGFTFPNHGESTLTHEVSSAKFRPQRSLLSELLAMHAAEGEEDMSHDEDSDDGEENDTFAPVVEAPTQVEGPSLLIQRSEPIEIPCAASFARQRAVDAYRRLYNQRRIEQLYLQQQQQLQYQKQQQLYIQQQQQRMYIQQQQRMYYQQQQEQLYYQQQQQLYYQQQQQLYFQQQQQQQQLFYQEQKAELIRQTQQYANLIYQAVQEHTASVHGRGAAVPVY